MRDGKFGGRILIYTIGIRGPLFNDDRPTHRELPTILRFGMLRMFPGY